MRCSGLPGPRPRAAQLPPQHIRGQPGLARRHQVGGADLGRYPSHPLHIHTLTPVYPPVCYPLPQEPGDVWGSGLGRPRGRLLLLERQVG